MLALGVIVGIVAAAAARFDEEAALWQQLNNAHYRDDLGDAVG